MSRNYDILHQESVYREQFRPASVPGPQKSHGSKDRAGALVAEEEITKLVQRVFLLSSKQPATAAVAFCGVDQNVGCTWVCARAAEALAEHVSARVCVVDGNFRSPRLHEHFRLERGSGLADAIQSSQPLTDFRAAYVDQQPVAAYRRYHRKRTLGLAQSGAASQPVRRAEGGIRLPAGRYAAARLLCRRGTAWTAHRRGNSSRGFEFHAARASSQGQARS